MKGFVQSECVLTKQSKYQQTNLARIRSLPCVLITDKLANYQSSFGAHYAQKRSASGGLRCLNRPWNPLMDQADASPQTLANLRPG